MWLKFLLAIQPIPTTSLTNRILISDQLLRLGYVKFLAQPTHSYLTASTGLILAAFIAG